MKTGRAGPRLLSNYGAIGLRGASRFQALTATPRLSPEDSGERVRLPSLFRAGGITLEHGSVLAGVSTCPLCPEGAPSLLAGEWAIQGADVGGGAVGWRFGFASPPTCIAASLAIPQGLGRWTDFHWIQQRHTPGAWGKHWRLDRPPRAGAEPISKVIRRTKPVRDQAEARSSDIGGNIEMERDKLGRRSQQDGPVQKSTFNDLSPVACLPRIEVKYASAAYLMKMELEDISKSHFEHLYYNGKIQFSFIDAFRRTNTQDHLGALSFLWFG